MTHDGEKQNLMWLWPNIVSKEYSNQCQTQSQLAYKIMLVMTLRVQNLMWANWPPLLCTVLSVYPTFICLNFPSLLQTSTTGFSLWYHQKKKKKKKLLSLEFGPHLSIFIGPTHCVAFAAFDMTQTKIQLVGNYRPNSISM